MSEVENQVVSMEFDNKNFEKNVKTSLSTLDKLKIGLATLTSTGSGILSVANSIKQITFDPVNDSVQVGIGKVMGLAAALTGVVNITDELYDITTRTIRSFTFDQIAGGFNKYEEKIKNVQVIMNAVRQAGETEEETMARIEPYLEKLSWFADETSYDFTEMVANIGRFTAAGNDLDTTVQSIMGIATWGAKAGAGTQAVSTAMYQLSQALGRGAIHLEDWKSIMNLHMDTEEFKRNALETAVALGTLRKEGEKYFTKSGTAVSLEDFTGTLNKDWLTTKVFLKVANEYGSAIDVVMARTKETGETASEALRHLREDGILISEDLGTQAFQAAMEAKTLTEAIEATRVAVASKFSDIYETVFGNFIEARDLWTMVSEKLWNIFAGPLDTVKDLMQAWKEAGGRAKIFEYLKRIFIEISDTFAVLQEHWGNTFGFLEDKGPLIDKFTNNLKMLSIIISNIFTNLRNNEKLWSSLDTFFGSLKRSVDVLKVGLKTVKERILMPFIKDILPKLNDKFSDIIESIGNFIQKIADGIIEYDTFNKIIDYTIELFKEAKMHIQNIKDAFTNITSNTTFKKMSDGMKEMADSIEAAGGPLEYFKTIFSNIMTFIENGLTNITPHLNAIWKLMLGMFAWLSKIFTNAKPMLEQVGGWIKGVVGKKKKSKV